MTQPDPNANPFAAQQQPAAGPPPNPFAAPQQFAQPGVQPPAPQQLPAQQPMAAPAAYPQQAEQLPPPGTPITQIDPRPIGEQWADQQYLAAHRQAAPGAPAQPQAPSWPPPPEPQPGNYQQMPVPQAQAQAPAAPVYAPQAAVGAPPSAATAGPGGLPSSDAWNQPHAPDGPGMPAYPQQYPPMQAAVAPAPPAPPTLEQMAAAITPPQQFAGQQAVAQPGVAGYAAPPAVFGQQAPAAAVAVYAGAPGPQFGQQAPAPTGVVPSQFAGPQPGQAPVLSPEQVAAMLAPPATQSKGPRMRELMGFLLVIVPKKVEQRISDLPGDKKGELVDRMTADVIVLSRPGDGTSGVLVWGGAPEKIPPRPHDKQNATPYVCKDMFIGQTGIISQCRDALANRMARNGGPLTAIGRLGVGDAKGDQRNPPYLLKPADDADMQAAIQFLVYNPQVLTA